MFCRLLRMLLILIVGATTLAAALTLLSPLRERCIASFPFGVCQLVYLCLVSLSMSPVGGYTGLRLKKIWDAAASH